MVASCYLMNYCGRFEFPIEPDAMWASIARPDRFESAWGWLTGLEMEGPALEAGSTLRGMVSPPVPYHMAVKIQLTRSVPAELIDAEVSGDLAGDAHLRLREVPQGTMAEVAWSLEMRQIPMRIAARVAYPLLRWGHDRVVEATVVGFRACLLRDPPADQRLPTPTGVRPIGR